MSANNGLRAALAEIAKIAVNAGIGDDGAEDQGGRNERGDARERDVATNYGCVLKSVPRRFVEEAARRAVRINPLNRPILGAHLGMGDNVNLDKASIAVLTSKYWGQRARDLTVSFMDSPSDALRRRIIEHLNAWNRCGGIRFVETGGLGQVRISREPGGYWSYLGTDILLIPRSRQTMNLEGFTMNTSEREFTRVVRHEAGHTLGFPHEHMRSALVARIDREKAYEFFGRTQGWTRQEVDQQVLTPLSESSVLSTPADQTSIMCYQLPGTITRDGRPILGGLDINSTDCRFAGQIYPKPGSAQLPSYEGDDEFDAEDWDASEYEDSSAQLANAADSD